MAWMDTWILRHPALTGSYKPDGCHLRRCIPTAKAWRIYSRELPGCQKMSAFRDSMREGCSSIKG
eukprot:1153806-Pelagomonas_calceolata.AAC.7